MNSATTYKTHTSGPEGTSRLGELIAKHLKGGEIIELASDLGGGKTVLARGIAKGLGYIGEVTSPTFTISRVYRLPKGKELHHFDFYRLEREDIVANELTDIAGDAEAVVVIEWAGQVGENLPKERIRISLKTVSESGRDILVESLGGKYDTVIAELKSHAANN